MGKEDKAMSFGRENEREVLLLQLREEFLVFTPSYLHFLENAFRQIRYLKILNFLILKT